MEIIPISRIRYMILRPKRFTENLEPKSVFPAHPSFQLFSFRQLEVGELEQFLSQH